MPKPSPTSKQPSSPGDQVNELRDLVVGYARQETIEPIKALQRFIGLGLAGAFAIGLGTVFLMLGLLRGLQQIDWFNGPTQRDGIHGSWLIYVITLVGGVLIILAALGAAKRSTSKRKAGSR